MWMRVGDLRLETLAGPNQSKVRLDFILMAISSHYFLEGLGQDQIFVPMEINLGQGEERD